MRKFGISVSALALVTMVGSAASNEVMFRGSPHTIGSPSVDPDSPSQPPTTEDPESEPGPSEGLSVATNGSTTLAYGAPWSLRFIVSGGSESYPEMIINGPLPAEVTQRREGNSVVLSGRTADGRFGPFALFVRDSEDALFQSTPVDVTVAEASVPATVSTPVDVVITNSNMRWDVPVRANGGLGPYRYSISPDLPSGVTMSNDANGVRLVGQSLEGRHGPYVVTMTDAVGKTSETSPFEIEVVGAPAPELAFEDGETIADIAYDRGKVFELVRDAPEGTTILLRGGTLPDGIAIGGSRLSIHSAVRVDSGERVLTVQARGPNGKLSDIRSIRIAATYEVSGTMTPDSGISNVEGPNAARPVVMTVTNTGNVPSGRLSVSQSNPSDFRLSGNSCTGTILEPRDTCLVVVERIATTNDPDDTPRTTEVSVGWTTAGRTASMTSLISGTATGIPDPIVITGPSAITVNANSSATVSWTVSGGVPPYRIQGSGFINNWDIRFSYSPTGSPTRATGTFQNYTRTRGKGTAHVTVYDSRDLRQDLRIAIN